MLTESSQLLQSADFCVSVLSSPRSERDPRRFLIDSGSTRPCIVYQIADGEELEATGENCEKVLLLDSQWALQLADRLGWPSCGLLYAWCWDLFFAAADTGLSFGSVEVLPHLQLQQASLVQFQGQHWVHYDPPGMRLPDLGLPSEPVLMLQALYLPNNMQRRGLGTRVINLLLARCQHNGQRLVVGPIVEEAMALLCAKLGFAQLPAAFMIK